MPNTFTDIAYHGTNNPLEGDLRVPAYGAFFTPYYKWAAGHYGPVVYSARLNLKNVYVLNYAHPRDDEIMDALFDRDYVALEEWVTKLKRLGYDAIQTVSDSEMICVFDSRSISDVTLVTD